MIPCEASLCALKGAVMYGFEPHMMTERVAGYTDGVFQIVGFKQDELAEKKNAVIDDFAFLGL